MIFLDFQVPSDDTSLGEDCCLCHSMQMNPFPGSLESTAEDGRSTTKARIDHASATSLILIEFCSIFRQRTSSVETASLSAPGKEETKPASVVV